MRILASRHVDLAGVLLVVAALAGCGTGAGPSPSLSIALSSDAVAIPGATTPSAPTQPRTSIATPRPASVTPRVRAGAPAYVIVSVATVWRSPSSARPVDEPALSNPVRIRAWLGAMSVADQAGLIGRADTQLLLGERVLVTAVRGMWAHVVVPDQPSPLDRRGYPGWVPLAQLTAIAPPVAATAATVVRATAWLRAAAGSRILEVSFGTTLPVVGGDETRVDLGLPGGGLVYARRVDVAVAASGHAPLRADAASIVASARQFVGLRYLWAGTSGFGFDCSGLVYDVYRAHGILLPRDGAPQATRGSPVGRGALRPGDLVFFARNGVIHHVAIYVGDGQILDSPQVGRPVRILSLDRAPFADEFWGARRVEP